MVVNGRETGFRRTMGANCDLADLAPDGDASKLGEAISGFSSKAIRTMAEFICILNKGYIDNRRYVEPEYSCAPLAPDEVLALDESDFMELMNEALAAYTHEAPTVETEPVPVKKTGKAVPARTARK